VLDGARHDVWSVNTEAEYHEEIAADAPPLDPALLPGFAKLDRVALGVASGVVAGMGLCLATLALVLKGGDVVGPHLGLLGQFLPGYEVSVAGSLVGLAWGAAGGFAVGWTFAVLRNAAALATLMLVRRRVERRMLGRLLDYV
jgi:hypothetical protein